MNIKLYSTNCPKCNVLEKKLEEAKIPFDLITDMEVIKEVATKYKVTQAPLLQVKEDSVMSFSEAIKWVKEEIENG